jgi:hypothetical protein
MSDAPETLRDLQAWMQQAVSRPHGPVDAVDERIQPSARQSAAERLEIYHSAYFARLIEVMQSMFPGLRFALEDEAFDELAVAYLQQHPPRSYTLNVLADRFVDFLVRTRPPRTSDVPDWADFVINLARLEAAIDEVFDGPGIEGEPLLDPQALTQLDAAAAGELQLKLAPCVRLLALAFPLLDWYTALRRDEKPALPAPEPSWLALHRRDYVVRRIPLERAEFVLLSALGEGQPLGAAIAAAAAVISPDELSALSAKLGDWFRDWAAAGMVRW